MNALINILIRRRDVEKQFKDKMCLQVMSLIDFHKPLRFDDFKSNFSQIRDINAFIQNPTTILIISGNLATGKSTIIDIIYNQLSETTEILRLSNHGNYQKDFINFTSKRSIEDLIFSKKKLILIDDVHLMDKSFISTLKTSIIPIIMTCQSKEELKVQELRRSVKLKAKYIKLNRISISDCLILVSDIVDKNNLNDEFDCDMIMQTIKEQKCNIRTILQSLPFTSMAQEDRDNHENKKTEFMGNYSDMNIYELTSYFLKYKVDEKFISMNLTGIISFVIYENALALLNLKSKTYENLCTYKNILRVLIENDDQQLDYSNESKNIHDYLQNVELNSILLKSNQSKLDSFKFTTVFNKLSIKSAFNKKINQHVQSCKSYCDPNVDIVVGRDILQSGDLDLLHKKIATDFKLD